MISSCIAQQTASVVPADGIAVPIGGPMNQGIMRAYKLLYGKQYIRSNCDQIRFRWWISSIPAKNGTATV